MFSIAVLGALKSQTVSTYAGIQYQGSGEYNATANNNLDAEYFSMPQSVAFDTNNRIWVTDQHNLHILDGCSLIGEGDCQQLGWINAVLPNHVGDAVGQSAGLTAARTSHHQQWTFMVIHRLALGVIQTSQKTHEAACCCSSIASSRKLSDRSFNSV